MHCFPACPRARPPAGDSYCGYPLKQWLLTGRWGIGFLGDCLAAVEGICRRLVRTTAPPGSFTCTDGKLGKIYERVMGRSCQAPTVQRGV